MISISFDYKTKDVILKLGQIKNCEGFQISKIIRSVFEIPGGKDTGKVLHIQC